MKKILLFGIAFFTGIQLQAQGWGQTQKLAPSDRLSAQRFGSSVDIDGNYAVVGVHVSGITEDAYVYEKDNNGNWVELQKLFSPELRQFDHFGTEVAISGDYILVGAWGQDYDENEANFVQGAGAAYIYKKQVSGLFEFQQKIAGSNRETNNHFAHVLDMNGDRIIVGALRDAFDTNGQNFIQNAGAAFIFERDVNGTWSEVQKIVASDRADTDYFGGFSVAISNNYALVGAPYEDEDPNDENTLTFAGSAYIFERDNNGQWSELQKIVPSNRSTGDQFGYSVDLDGDYAVVGAWFGLGSGNNEGSAYLYKRDTSGVWYEQQELIVSEVLIAGDHYGHSVSMDNDKIAVGAYHVNIGNQLDVGAAFVFERDNTDVYNQTGTMFSLNYASSDFFGYRIAISGDNAIVGAYLEDEDENHQNNLSDSGSVYMFNASEPSNLPPLNTLSVIDNDFSTIVKAYPNPVKDLLTLDLGSLQETIEINVYNILGQKVFSKIYSSKKTIKLELNQPKGMYLVEVNTEGRVSSIVKVVKQ